MGKVITAIVLIGLVVGLFALGNDTKKSRTKPSGLPETNPGINQKALVAHETAKSSLNLSLMALDAEMQMLSAAITNRESRNTKHPEDQDWYREAEWGDEKRRN